ncbi:MAG: arginine--tRNA ligase [Anaerolineales bacterium]|nr:arginine--tRNA ligase [Anaerolineales bacterium]
MFEKELHQATETVRSGLKRLHLPGAESIHWLPTPFAGDWGYGTAVCFKVAALEARADRNIKVPQRAHEIANLLLDDMKDIIGFDRVEAVGGYLNLHINTSVYAQRVTDRVINKGQDFGRGAKKDERVMVEYAQPNTHHSFHIGHARNAILGEALARLVEFAGFDTIRASYPGDIGLGVVTCMWAYEKFHQGQEPEGVHERGQWLGDIYTEATTLVTPQLDESEGERQQRLQYDAERRALYKKWDDGDPYVRELWRRTRQWSLDEFADILRILDIDIDVFFFESEVDEPAKRIAEELIQLGIAEDERPDGPVIVKIDEKLHLKNEKYRTTVILRSDGTTLYSTNDLALAKDKFENYHVDRSVYVVDVRQSLHFQQVFKILELWGFPQAEKCFHLAHGFVTLPEGAMSARKGNVILFMDVLAEAERRVRAIIEEKNPNLTGEQRETVVRQIGLGALFYGMLSVDNNKDIVFNLDEALSFEGQSAPYIQNAYVRANSILRKVKGLPESTSFEYKLDPTEIELIDVISRFPSVLQKAAEAYKPLLIATYTFELAKAFHLFYHAVRVLQADDEQTLNARLRITAAAKETIAIALNLLGIEVPEAM